MTLFGQNYNINGRKAESHRVKNCSGSSWDDGINQNTIKRDDRYAIKKIDKTTKRAEGPRIQRNQAGQFAQISLVMLPTTTVHED